MSKRLTLTTGVRVQETVFLHTLARSGPNIDCVLVMLAVVIDQLAIILLLTSPL